MPGGGANPARRARPWTPGAIACMGLASGALASMAGGGLATLASVVLVLLASAWMPALYLLGALGLGVWAQRLAAPDLERPWAIRAGLGLAAMLTITQLLGITGLIGVRGVALVPVVVGITILVLPVVRAGRIVVAEKPSWLWIAGMPAIGVMLAAACSPPGWLWSSEFGGYDTLSYHLQLPREWLAMGRVWPVEHNVYSFLPGYVEAAFLHVAVLMGAGKTGLVTPEGSMLAAAQLLHAGMAIAAVLLTASAARAVLERAGSPHARGLAPLAGGLVLATPWAVVTGSMAYNEMAVLALFASALAAALAGELSPVRRGVIVGVLVGVACGCKPTALLFCAPACGLAMLWERPRRTWLPLVLGACAGGVAMLLPWLVRNWMACGNPVFPQLTGVFGAAHWSAEQVARYRSGHSFEGGVLDALRLFVLPEASGEHRGILHAQWALFGPMTLVGVGISLAVGRTHRMAAMVAMMLLMQLLAWLALTHVQSRFLMPMLVPGAVGVALGLSAIPWAGLARTLGFLAVLTQSLATGVIFLGQKMDLSGPNAATLFGPALFADAPADADDRAIGPVAFLNTRLPKGSRVLVVGDAAVLYIRVPFAYATTWDTSPLLAVIREHPDEPAAWSPALRGQGYTHVYADLAELDRLALSGWSDPMLDAGYVVSWLAAHARPVYKDEQGQRLVYELP